MREEYWTGAGWLRREGYMEKGRVGGKEERGMRGEERRGEARREAERRR